MAAGRTKQQTIHDLALIIDDLEAKGRLARVTDPVDPAYDLAGIAYQMEGAPHAVLFENVIGQEWPVFTGLYWSREMLADVMRRDEAALPQFVSGCIQKWQQAPIAPIVVPDGPVREVTEDDVDLTRMPIPIHATKDGGPYFDAGVVIARDPDTGVRNASIQRFQVVDRDLMYVNIDSGRHLGLYIEKAAARGESLTFTLNCGVGPGLHFAASAPAEAAPADTDELGIASQFHGEPLELVEGDISDAEMVSHAMWALECEIIPGELANEGPFAEVTNYYATVAPRPVVHVRRIHRRANPVFHTILSGMEVWNSVGLLGEANALALVQRQVPGVHDVYFSHGGCGFYHCIVQMSQTRAGWAKQAIMAAFAAFPPLKMVTVVDEDVDLRSAQDVEWAMATRLDPTSGIVTIDKAFGHGLNPSFPDYLGPKVGFDCTKPFPPRQEYERATYKAMSLDGLNIRGLEAGRPQNIGTDFDATSIGGSTSVKKSKKRRLQKLAEQKAGGGAKPKAAKASKKADRKREEWEADLARPAPADFTVPKPIPPGASIEAESEDPDDWIARPAPADFTVPKPHVDPAPPKPAAKRQPAKRSAAKPVASKPASAKPPPSKPAAPKPGGPKPAAAKPAAKKTAPPRTTTAKPASTTSRRKPVARKKPTPDKGGGGFFQGGGM